jgi:ribosomal protein S18 acetylase RimI-like enzyme
MKFRQLLPDDLPHVARLWNRVNPLDAASEAVLHEKIWGDVDFASDLTLVPYGADDPNRAPVGFAMALRRPDLSDRAFIKLVAVDTRFQRQGIGSQMVQQLESQLAGHASEIRVAESAPNYLTPGVDSRNTAAISFFTQLGYQHFADAVNQRVDLRHWQPGEPLLRGDGAAFTLRRAELSDSASIVDLLQSHWPSWQAEVLAALGNTPPTLFVALCEDRVVGFAAHDANNRGTGWFGPMGTSPECQGRGVGRRLLELCLRDMQQQGHAVVTIPWVGPVDFYTAAVGAEEDRRFHRFRKDLIASQLA